MPTSRQPLTTLLSQALVAWTIEFDNEFERQMPHRTTEHGATAPQGPWLASLVTWTNFLRFVPKQGITVREFYLRAGLERKVFRQRLKRMSRWWGYLTFVPPPGGSKSSPPADWIVLPSAAANKAWQIWPALFEEIETRWRERFGKPAIDQLRQALASIAPQLDANLPEAMPILNVVWAGWFAEPPQPPKHPTPVESPVPHLSAMLAKTLFTLTLDFESQSELSLAIGSNLIRVLNDTGIPIRDLPRLSGVSKEAIKMMLGFLTKNRFAIIEPSPATPRTKQVRLTTQGNRIPGRLPQGTGRSRKTLAKNLRQRSHPNAPNISRSPSRHPQSRPQSSPIQTPGQHQVQPPGLESTATRPRNPAPPPTHPPQRRLSRRRLKQASKPALDLDLDL